MKYISDFVKKQNAINAKNVIYYSWLSENGTYKSGKKKLKKAEKKSLKRFKRNQRNLEAVKMLEALITNENNT